MLSRRIASVALAGALALTGGAASGCAHSHSHSHAPTTRSHTHTQTTCKKSGLFRKKTKCKSSSLTHHAASAVLAGKNWQ